MPWMKDYHGREQKLVGTVVDAVELDDGGVVAYVDDRDGEASEFVEALERVELAIAGAHGEQYPEKQLPRIMRELREHAAMRLLHGEVEGVRT